MNPLRQLSEHGQSVWYDDIQRGLIWTGTLYRMVEEDGLSGLTSNPSIFEKAIGKSDDYFAAVRCLVERGLGPVEIYERLATEDIQLAADILRPVYERTEGRDGFVSFEVSPHLGGDTEGTLIGAGVGAGAGYIVGNEMDKSKAHDDAWHDY